MANTLKENVWVVDTTGAFPFDLAQVVKVKLVAGADAATLTLKSDGVSGTVIYTIAAGAAAEKFEEVFIRSKSGLYATLTGTAPKAYVYLR
jgi:hypothetical protein